MLYLPANIQRREEGTIASPPRQHRHLGAYGVCTREGKALLIRKARGPYRGLLDLPGGGIEFGEQPEAALRREFQEETGLTIATCMLRGVESMRVRYVAEDGVDEELHHIGLIYDVSLGSPVGSLPTPKSDADGEDSGDAAWYFLNNDDLDARILTPFASRTLREVGSIDC